MRAFIPTTKLGKLHGDKRRKTKYEQLSPRSIDHNPQDWVPGVSNSQDEYCDTWTQFCDSNELHISESKQTPSQKNTTPNDAFRQHRRTATQLGNHIDRDPTASTASSSGSQTAENSPRAKLPITFHFDIEVVKSTARTNESSQYEDETLSKASSSTISTQSTKCQRVFPLSNRSVDVPGLSKQVTNKRLTKNSKYQEEVQKVVEDFPPQTFDGAISQHTFYGRILKEDAWTIPNFLEKKIEEQVDETTAWITFGTDSFAPPQNNLSSSTTNDPTCITKNTCTMKKKRNPWNKEQPTSPPLQPKALFKQHNLQSMSGQANSATFQRNAPDAKKNVAVMSQKEVLSESSFSHSMAGRTLDSTTKTTPQKSKIGKLPNNTMFLSNMLQKNIGDGLKAMPTAPATKKKDDNPNAQSSNAANTNTHLSTIERTTTVHITTSELQGEPNPLTSTKTSISLLSSMLQNRKASKTAPCAMQKSVSLDPRSNNVVSEVQSPATPLTNSEDATGVDWDNLSEQAFSMQLNTPSAEYAKYSKMLKVGLPMAVIKNAMQRDGIAMSNTTTNEKASDTEAESKPRFRIHWTVHNNVRSNTLWAMIQRERHWLANVILEEAELASWFQKKDTTVQRAESARMEPKPPQRGVIDPKRANNCGILLATIKMSYAEIARVIDQYSLEKLTLTQMNGLAQCLPTKEEAVALQTMLRTNTTTAEKSECERFMVEMMRVQNAKEKLEAMSFLKRLPTRLDELVHGTRCFE
jgi:Formin Homology 2 Domain